MKTKGIGLLELMLALSIIAVLLVAATRYFKSTDSSRKVNAAVDILQVVINASEDWRTTNNNYADISLAALQKQGLLPGNTEWTESSGNPWGGGIKVTTNDSGKTIALTLTQVPLKECNSLSDLMLKKGVTAQTCTNSEYNGNYSS